MHFSLACQTYQSDESVHCVQNIWDVNNIAFWHGTHDICETGKYIKRKRNIENWIGQSNQSITEAKTDH